MSNLLTGRGTYTNNRTFDGVSTRALALVALLLAAFVVSLTSTTGASANFVATGQDPAGDSADASPARDIVRVGLAYDRRTGNLKGGVRLAGSPSSDTAANLTVFAGRTTSGGCTGYPAIGFGTQTDLTGADWVLLHDSASPPVRGDAEKVYDEVAEEYEATEDALRGKRPNCVIARLNQPADPGNVFDIAGPVKLRGLPELEARFGNVPAIFYKGRTRKIRTIRPGSKRKVTLRITLSRRAQKLTDLKLTAKTRSGIRAQVEERLYLTQSSGSGGGGGSGGTNLCYEYHWLPPYSKLVIC